MEKGKETWPLGLSNEMDAILRINLEDWFNFVSPRSQDMQPLLIDMKQEAEVIQKLVTAIKERLPESFSPYLAERLPLNISLATKAFNRISIVRRAFEGTPSRNYFANDLVAALFEIHDVKEKLYYLLQIQDTLSRSGNEFDGVVAEAREKLSIIEQETATVKQLSAEAQDVMPILRSIAGGGGVVHNADRFDEERKHHEASAKDWLYATAAFFGLIALLLVRFYIDAEDLKKAKGADDFLHFAVFRVATISLLLSAAIWTSKSYRAHKHNATLNRHRANALASFQLFAAATKDDQTKNAVLLAATKCIFDPQPTGYSSGDTDSPAPIQVMEFFKSGGGKG